MLDYIKVTVSSPKSCSAVNTVYSLYPIKLLDVLSLYLPKKYVKCLLVLPVYIYNR